VKVRNNSPKTTGPTELRH